MVGWFGESEMKEIPKNVHMPGVVVPASVLALGVEAGGLTV